MFLRAELLGGHVLHYKLRLARKYFLIARMPSDKWEWERESPVVRLGPSGAHNAIFMAQKWPRREMGLLLLSRFHHHDLTSSTE
jgi:hypothetical protein